MSKYLCIKGKCCKAWASPNNFLSDFSDKLSEKTQNKKKAATIYQCAITAITKTKARFNFRPSSRRIINNWSKHASFSYNTRELLIANFKSIKAFRTALLRFYDMTANPWLCWKNVACIVNYAAISFMSII